MKIKDLFRWNVTRDIPPVVYFHDQAPQKIEAEINEYIVTGGWPESHPNHSRVPSGIHEQYVRLLTAIHKELEKKGGPELPTAWISGFYGSGKSSFAKLLGLALDGTTLPSGKSAAEAWLARDTSPKAEELRKAWSELRAKVDSMAVIFDVGSKAKDGDQLHTVALRQVQDRLDYSRADERHVADFEIKLEKSGDYERFLELVQREKGEPWSAIKDRPFAEDDFSLVLSKLRPDNYPEPTSWVDSRAGTFRQNESPEDAAKLIKHMLDTRAPGKTLFIVVDEVSQFALAGKDRADRLRAFASALGAHLHGRAWLLALGQQKIDDQAGDDFSVWAKDRFPSKLRVHLEPTNIRDVVHKRLLHKKDEHEKAVIDLFEKHRHTLGLYAYGCKGATPQEFADVYPMLPGQIDLVLQITSALRARSSRAQGDDHGIRGLLQLLGELFRDPKLGLVEKELGALITLDHIYEVQYTALDTSIQESMARIANHCAEEASEAARLWHRAAKCVALLELLQETGTPTTVELVAQCLFDHVDRGDQTNAVRDALEHLRRKNLLGYSEKDGYKVQSTAGEEWQLEREGLRAPAEDRSECVHDALKNLMGRPDRPKLHDRTFRWAAVYSDGRKAQDAKVEDPRDPSAVRVDFRFLTSADQRTKDGWLTKSASDELKERIIWVVGEPSAASELARSYVQSRSMVQRYKPRRESLTGPQKIQLQQEENNLEELLPRFREAVASAFMSGSIYFRGRQLSPSDFGAGFAAALVGVANKILPDLYPHFDATQLQPGDISVLLANELSGPSPKLLTDELGIVGTDSGRLVPSCEGAVPTRVFEKISQDDGASGEALLTSFGGPPFGYAENVIKACLAGLLRASKIRIEAEGNPRINAVRDPGVRDVFEKDRAFKRAMFLPAGDDELGIQWRNRIRSMLEQRLGMQIESDESAIADVVSQRFPEQASKLRSVSSRLRSLSIEVPKSLDKLGDVLEKCVAGCRETRPTVLAVKRYFDVLSDGLQQLAAYDAELTDAVCAQLRTLLDTRDHYALQLREVGELGGELEAAASILDEQLAGARPWVDMAAAVDAAERVRSAYVQERETRLAWQAEQAGVRRDKLKRREGYATLTADQSNAVLRFFASVQTPTGPEALQPTLAELKSAYLVDLAHAEEEANEKFDEILSQASKVLVERVSLGIENRELSTEEDVKALLSELEEKLMAKVRSGVRVRIKS